MDMTIYGAIKNYIAKDFSRLHTPGHGGGELGVLSTVTPFDITEIRGADSLFEPEGAIAQTEARLSAHYKTAATLLSAGGSTLCIQAMLRLVAEAGGKIVLGRGAHVSAINAMALLGLEPIWCHPSQGLDMLPEQTTAEQVRAALVNLGGNAVYITSPDYFGRVADIAAIAGVCREFSLPLLVDNAHGAELFAIGKHPVQLGADMCCDSLHKTLPVLTGGALLHIANPKFVEGAKGAMAMFGSTSPSYLIMLSVDMLLAELESGSTWAKNRALSKKVAAIVGVKDFINDLPNRIAIPFFKFGLDRAGMGKILDLHMIEPEYLSGHYCVLLFGQNTRNCDFERVEKLIADLPSAEPIAVVWDFTVPKIGMSLREAAFAKTQHLPICSCEGRICAEVISHCPPGIPLCIYGEILEKEQLNILKSYGIEAVSVVK